MFNLFNKKEAPLLGLQGSGGGLGFLAGGGSSVEESDEYLYLPFNESSSSRTKFGNYSSSVTLNSGGAYQDTIHPYSITDSTYNSGNARTHRCNGQSDTAYLMANTKLGSIGTGDICLDVWYNWRGTGNGGGSYGYIGDVATSFNIYSSHTGRDENNAFKLGGIGNNVLSGYTYGGTNQNIATSLSTTSNLNTWYHALVLRKSNKWYTFVNGVLNAYYAESGTHNIANGGGFHFGTIDRGGHWWYCNIADFMWQKGSDVFYDVSGLDASNIGTTYFTTPKYKNKIMAIPSNSGFSILKKPTGFTSS
jgi:hypothetical protein